VAQAERVIELLRALVEWFLAHPDELPLAEHGGDKVAAAVHHVSGMTDRFALRLAVERLGWDPAKLPRGV
jgi:dGTPase